MPTRTHDDRHGLVIILAVWACWTMTTAIAGRAASVTAPRWLAPPELDAMCRDSSYDEAGSLVLTDAGGAAVGKARIFHSSLDLYVCLTGLPSGPDPGSAARHIRISVDPDHSRGPEAEPGDLSFRLGADGKTEVFRGASGRFVPVEVRPDDFRAAVQSTGPKTWGAELAVSLEWLGGYARTDGFHLAVEGEGVAALWQWPKDAEASVPSTWGDLVLAPLYPEDVAAGSAFMDGREGYLAVPFAPALHPAGGMTWEAWVRVVDGDCGTLVGHGQASSYWLGLCDAVLFGTGGRGSVRRGANSLGKGWHHVAVTVDAGGVRTLYLDGQVEARPGFKWSTEASDGDHVPVLGVTDRPLRIGSDRDVPAEEGALHGYVRELRLWNRARSAAEVRETAFDNLKGGEPGLVSLWPFTHGLEDVAGGRHAGLVGNASLARRAPDVEAFPKPPPETPYEYPDPEPEPAWKAGLDLLKAEVQVDGVCRAVEYEGAADVALEPERALKVKLLMTPEALYLCVPALYGSAENKADGLTLWLDRAGRGGPEPGARHLRLRLTPSGELAAGTWDGAAYRKALPAELESRTLTGDRIVGEDLRAVESPVWSGEVRVPLEALAPFQPGAPLRLALRYEGTVAANAIPRQPDERRLVASWPERVNGQVPDTWGKVPTAGSSTRGLRPAQADGDGDGDGGLVCPSGRAPVSTAAADHTHPASLFGARHNAPSVAAFHHKCPGSPGGVNGTLRELAKLISYGTDKDSKWPLVDTNTLTDAHHVVQAAGVLQKIYVSPEDSSYIHDSHDLDMIVAVEAGDVWLSMLTDDNGVTTRGVLKLETETLSAPPNRDSTTDVRPSIGDHVTAAGRWIFDCGHPPKTEIHPVAFLESDREEIRPVFPGGEMRQARVVRIWLNSDPRPFRYCFDGPLEFDVDFPSPGWMPYVRVVQGDPSKVSWRVIDGRARVTIDPPASTGTFFFEMTLGHLDQPATTQARASRIYTVTFDEILVHRDRDPGGSGEWYMAANVNGRWRQVFWDRSVDDGDTISLSGVTPVTVVGGDLRLQITAYDRDPSTVFDKGGDWVTPDPEHPDIDGYDLGPLNTLVGSQAHEPAGSDWRLSYTVTRGGTVPSSLVSASFWEPLLADEPNDEAPTSLGVVPVPVQGSGHKDHTAYLTEAGDRIVLPDQTELQLHGADVDLYTFTMEDFADATFEVLPPGPTVEADRWDPWYWVSHMPDDVKVLNPAGAVEERSAQDTFGYSGARLAVRSPNGDLGRRQYTLRVTSTYREVPPDWGEAMDAQGGRLVDLVAADEEPATRWEPAKRTVTMDWAWQHVPGDVDRYDLFVPALTAQLAGGFQCPYNNPGRLIVSARGRLELPSLGQTGVGAVVVDLGSNLASGGHLTVEVHNSSTTRRRAFYYLSADWEDARFYTRQECDELRRQLGLFRAAFPENRQELLKGIIALSGGRPLEPRGPRPDPSPMELTALGRYRLIRLEDGDRLDGVLASGAGRPVSGRLYDSNGVLLAESVTLDASAGEGVAVPEGQVPRARLTAEGLEAGEMYFLQVVPEFAVGDRRSAEAAVGFSEWIGPRD